LVLPRHAPNAAGVTRTNVVLSRRAAVAKHLEVFTCLSLRADVANGVAVVIASCITVRAKCAAAGARICCNFSAIALIAR